MAQINIKINAYFTPKRPKHMIDYKDLENPSSEALWFTAANVLEYMESIGIKKDCYIGLLGYESLYVLRTGETFGVGSFFELAQSAHLSHNANKIFQDIFEQARKIYIKSEISKDKTKLYQFSEKDTLNLVKQMFEHKNYNVECC